jgi:hypothetical protein
MNGRHWSDFSEAQLAALRRGPVRASATPPDVTAQTRRLLTTLPAARPEPAYPAHWLPEVKANQIHDDWMKDNAPDPVEHRNGTAPAGEPPAEAYPASWLNESDFQPRGGLGGEGFINRKAA